MKNTIRTVQKYHIAYSILPFKRNQDVVRIIAGNKDYDYVMCVVDGWNNPNQLKGDVPGRNVAKLVADLFPNKFLRSTIKDTGKRAKTAATLIDDTVNKLSPHYASAVASFLFHGKEKDVIVSVGDVETYLWDGDKWYKPKEISDHWIDPTKYPSNVSRFFGCWERKQYPIFSAEPDVVSIASGTPVMIATDGIKDVLAIDDINSITKNVAEKTPKTLIAALVKEIQRRKTQKDDISILARGLGKTIS